MKVGIVPFLTFKKLGKRKIMILFFAKYFMAYLYIFVLIVITVTFQILELFEYIHCKKYLFENVKKTSLKTIYVQS